MITAREVASPDRVGPIDSVRRVIPAAVLVYFLLIGGTAIGEVDSSLRLLNALIGAAVITVYIGRPLLRVDILDLAAIGATVLFAIAGVFSTFPRQSLDAVAAALAYCAAFSVCRELLQAERGRRLFIVAIRATAAVLITVAASRWLLPMVEWWAGTGWQVLPLFNFEHSGAPWGHRHDLALLIVMTYPAWLIGRWTAVRAATATILGVLTTLLVVADGSRALWLAILVTSAVVLGTRVALIRSFIRRHVRVAMAISVLAVVILVITGVGGEVVQRAINTATLEYRGPMWSAIVSDWATHPLTGNGPGSFPWILQGTGYFDTNSLAPRHPDSSVFQGIAEGGVFLLAAMCLLLVALRRGRSEAAWWASITFALAGLLASPADFAFLIVIAMCWVAYNHPREDRIDVARPEAIRRKLALGLAAVAFVGLAVVNVGAFAYDQARAYIAGGRLGDAADSLGVAIALDPGMALYHRQRGTVRYLLDDHDGAVVDFQAATRINPADDLAWRSLALGREGAGDRDGAREALARAVATQRSDPTNLLLQVALRPTHTEALIEVVQAWPEILYSVSWDGQSETPVDAIVMQAVQRWSDGYPIPERREDQGLWLTSLVEGAASVAKAEEESPWSVGLDRALSAAIQCKDVSQELDALGAADWRQPLYWHLRMRSQGAGEPIPDIDAARMAGLMGSPVSERLTDVVLNPMHENGRYSADLWGYRRAAIAWPSIGIELPSPVSGYARWVLEPRC